MEGLGAGGEGAHVSQKNGLMGRLGDDPEGKRCGGVGGSQSECGGGKGEVGMRDRNDPEGGWQRRIRGCEKEAGGKIGERPEGGIPASGGWKDGGQKK